jgi:hypothetical protein
MLQIAIVMMTSFGKPFADAGQGMNGCGNALSGIALRLTELCGDTLVKSHGVGKIPSPLRQGQAFSFDSGVRDWT